MEGPPVEPPVYSKRSIINVFSCTNSETISYILLPVYYKVFNEKGPLPVLGPVYSNNPYIGRVDANDIPPPHNVTSLIQCICAKEKKGFGVDWDRGDAWKTELFKTISSPNAFDLKETLSLLTTDRLGSRPQEPLILKVVYSGME
jgi:hypothetical protein